MNVWLILSIIASQLNRKTIVSWIASNQLNKMTILSDLKLSIEIDTPTRRKTKSLKSKRLVHSIKSRMMKRRSMKIKKYNNNNNNKNKLNSLILKKKKIKLLLKIPFKMMRIYKLKYF